MRWSLRDGSTGASRLHKQPRTAGLRGWDLRAKHRGEIARLERERAEMQATRILRALLHGTPEQQAEARERAEQLVKGK